jgi:serine/threonine protein kinase
MADGPPTAALEPMNPGDRLDYYRVESIISHTGIATLLRATDVRTGAIVVLKVPDPDMESDVAYFERFQREQRIGKHLAHLGWRHRHSSSAAGALVYVGLALIPVFFALMLYATHHW